MEEWDVEPLELVLALLLLSGGIHVVSLILNRETGLFYLLVGDEVFRWNELNESGKEQLSIPIHRELTGPVLESGLALLLLIGVVHVASLILNREVGLFYFGIGGDIFRWKTLF